MLGHRQRSVGGRRDVVRPHLVGASLVAAAVATLVWVSSAPAAPAAASVSVTLSDFAIRVSTDTVPVGRVSFRVVNRGNAVHDFTFAGKRTRALSNGQHASFSVMIGKAGTYRFISAQPGDRAIGMAGSLRVAATKRGKPKPRVTRSRLELVTIAKDLGALTFVAAPPGDPSRLMVVRQDGVILLFKNGVRTERPFLDLRNMVRSDGENGLLSIAFAPDYAQSGRFYVYYTNRNGNIRLTERRRSESNADAADSSSRRVLAIRKETANHNGGMMQFGPDGSLFVAVGDGGADPPRVPVGRAGQDRGNLFGTIIRIDPRRGSPYLIPPDNPFVSMEGTRPEIVAFGLRNPWRFWIDYPTNAMLIGDVGEGAREEIDRLPLNRLGLNFGWPCKEGTTVPPKVTTPANCAAARLTAPLFEYPHDERRCSITGGVVARDSIVALNGLYLWSDFCEGRINGLTPQGKRVPLNLKVDQPTSFGIAAGHIYIATATGTLHRLNLNPQR